MCFRTHLNVFFHVNSHLSFHAYSHVSVHTCRTLRSTRTHTKVYFHTHIRTRRFSQIFTRICLHTSPTPQRTSTVLASYGTFVSFQIYLQSLFTYVDTACVSHTHITHFTAHIERASKLRAVSLHASRTHRQSGVIGGEDGGGRGLSHDIARPDIHTPPSHGAGGVREGGGEDGAGGRGVVVLTIVFSAPEMLEWQVASFRYCNTLQRTATPCRIPQRTATH